MFASTRTSSRLTAAVSALLLSVTTIAATVSVPAKAATTGSTSYVSALA